MHVIMDEFHSIFKVKKERHLFLEIRAQSKHHIIQNSGHKPMMLFLVLFFNTKLLALLAIEISTPIIALDLTLPIL